MIYLRLFYEFFKAGLFAFGGGMATVPFLFSISERTGWFTTSELANMIAVSDCTPGPIGVNMATYVGYTSAGILGGVVATLGLIAPEIIVILIIAKLFLKFRDNQYVDSALKGLRPASLALILTAALGVMKISLLNLDLYRETGELFTLVNYKSVILAVVIFFAIKKLKGHPIIYIAASALVGIVFRMAA